MRKTAVALLVVFQLLFSAACSFDDVDMILMEIIYNLQKANDYLQRIRGATGEDKRAIKKELKKHREKAEEQEKLQKKTFGEQTHIIRPLPNTFYGKLAFRAMKEKELLRKSAEKTAEGLIVEIMKVEEVDREKFEKMLRALKPAQLEEALLRAAALYALSSASVAQTLKEKAERTANAVYEVFPNAHNREGKPSEASTQKGLIDLKIASATVDTQISQLLNKIVLLETFKRAAKQKENTIKSSQLFIGLYGAAKGNFRFDYENIVTESWRRK